MPSRRELANAIRALSMDAVEAAKSGHPGMPLGMADIAEVLWNDFLQHNPSNPHWVNRDRFVLSNGHGSMLQYALLHLTGYELSLDDLKAFRSLYSKTPGHPEVGHTPGVETTTGPLGQGLANAVGMSIAEAVLAATFNRENHSIVDHYTYCFVGDGCLMEGISHEVCSLAGTLGLGKLIVFWDDNGISIDGKIEQWCMDDTPKRFEAYGWHVETLDGHDPEAIKQAIVAAQQETSKPSFLACRTTIGFGSPLAGDAKCHGAPLGTFGVQSAREKLQWSHEPFMIPNDIAQQWNARQKGEERESIWQDRFSVYTKEYPELAEEFQRRIAGKLPKAIIKQVMDFAQSVEQKADSLATRKASQNVLATLVETLPELLGGSADLSESNLTHCQTSKAIERGQFSGNYLYYGVREFGMSAIMNGLALHRGFIPYGGTFLTFLDYGRNAVRLSALMKQRVIFVYTHDSVGLGEDGPTHQPIEHINLLRTTPNMSVWRPCDATETVVAWLCALQRTTGPTSLLLSRQKIPHQSKTRQQMSLIARGGYVLVEAENPDILLIATGSEVHLAVLAARQLNEEGHAAQVVSMPSTDTFLSQDSAYQESVLPVNVKTRIVVEAGSPDYWYRWVGMKGKVIGIDRYGESAPGAIVLEALGITVDRIVSEAKSLLATKGQ